jgi:hypothetical protein
MSTAARRLAAGLALGLALVWPATILAATTTVSAQVCAQTFAPATLSTSEPSPTANASAAVSGTAQPASAITITVGGVVRATLAADGGGLFAATVPLVVGNNVVVATADDGPFCGHVSTSPAVQIQRNLVAPDAPSISAPPSGEVTTATSELVQGSAEHDATLDIYVNGTAAATLTLGADGLFAVTIPLSLGANSIQARATNPAGAGPLSAAVTVTRQSVSIQAPARSLRTVVSAAPQITSPTSGASTSASAIIIQLSGQPGATALISNNGTQMAHLLLPSSGTAAVSVPLTPGDNVITVTIAGVVSPPVIVHHAVPTPPAPAINGPSDGWSTSDSFAQISGNAAPGSLVTVYVGADQMASVTADETGHFEARANLRVGLNLIYASTTLPDGQQLKSTLVQVNRDGSLLENSAVQAKTGLAILAIAPAAAVVLTAQGVGEVLGAVASSPSSTVLVLSFAVAASTASTGLLGLELILLVPGLIRAAARRLPPGAIRGRVLDAVTGRPLALAKISVGGRRLADTISGFDGRFAVEAGAANQPLQVARPGFQPAGPTLGARELTITLEPAAARFSRLRVLIDLFVGAVSWIAMGFSAALGVYLVLQHPSLLTVAIAALALGLLSANVFAIATQPLYHWGRLTDLQGIPISDAVLKLAYRGSGAVVSTYRTDRSGRYTLHAPSRGHYRLTVQLSEHSPVHEEAITIRRRGSYLGFGLKLPR